MVAPGVLCADTQTEAERLLTSARLFRRRIRQGDVRPIPTPEDAITELGSSPAPPSTELGDWPRYFAGTSESVRDQLIDMASVLHVEELMIVTIVHDHRARMRSYELLAEAFNLTPRSI
jgi:alkanesulfonate monooxygenase SsuD/methylene tetrahydromethanopterin reductase-like flavin-dependent oxidoreductase (luciferase family)